MKKILVADDERALRFLIVETLQMEDYEIIEVEDGEEALKKTYEMEPDLLILDLMMPKVTGYEVAEEIKKQKNIKQPKTMILTAKGEKEAKERALEAGVDHFMKKPFSPIELLHIVETVLEEDE